MRAAVRREAVLATRAARVTAAAGSAGRTPRSAQATGGVGTVGRWAVACPRDGMTPACATSLIEAMAAAGLEVSTAMTAGVRGASIGPVSGQEVTVGPAAVECKGTTAPVGVTGLTRPGRTPADRRGATAARHGRRGRGASGRGTTTP